MTKTNYELTNIEFHENAITLSQLKKGKIMDEKTLTLSQLKKLKTHEYEWAVTITSYEDSLISEAKTSLYYYKTKKDTEIFSEAFTDSKNSIRIVGIDIMISKLEKEIANEERKSRLISEALAAPHLTGDALIKFLEEV